MKKKGVSIIIGYVLLVVFALIIGTTVYNVLKTYIPKDVPECPEGVSIFVKDITYTGDSLNLTTMNTGLFDIAGYFIRATNSPNQKIATKDLSEFLNPTNAKAINGIVIFLGEDNPMKPDDKQTQIFNLDEEIYSIEIIPVRFQEEDNKNKFLSCGNSKIKEKIVLKCIPECGLLECGPDPICGTECGPCTGTDVCTGGGQCVAPEECTDTCESLGYECGTWTICGASEVCPSSCNDLEICNSTGQCEVACGNGVLFDSLPGTIPEECDDGNTDNLDGCSSTCQIEEGWDCNNEPSTCFTCNYDSICDTNENCACSDCENKKDGCNQGWMCQSGSCVQGTAVGSCKQYCSYLGYNDVSSGCALNCGGGCDGTCETGGDQYCSSPTSYCCCVPY